MPFKKNQIVTLQIESLSNDGSGVAHQDGQAVFVPLTAPGDVTEVRIVKPMKTYAFGRVEKLITAGPNRIQQDCPVAGPCGGCGLRHISYQAECAAKTQFVRDAFARLGKLDVPVLDVLAAPAVDRYRNKVQLPVAEELLLVQRRDQHGQAEIEEIQLQQHRRAADDLDVDGGNYHWN